MRRRSPREDGSVFGEGQRVLLAAGNLHDGGWKLQRPRHGGERPDPQFPHAKLAGEIVSASPDLALVRQKQRVRAADTGRGRGQTGGDPAQPRSSSASAGGGALATSGFLRWRPRVGGGRATHPPAAASTMRLPRSASTAFGPLANDRVPWPSWPSPPCPKDSAYDWVVPMPGEGRGCCPAARQISAAGRRGVSWSLHNYTEAKPYAGLVALRRDANSVAFARLEFSKTASWSNLRAAAGASASSIARSDDAAPRTILNPCLRARDRGRAVGRSQGTRRDPRPSLGPAAKCPRTCGRSWSASCP